MPRQKQQQRTSPLSPPATTPEDREKQLIRYAVDLAEKQLVEGTARTQTIVHYLRMSSPKERLEKEILELKKELIKAQTEKVKAEQRSEEVYREALQAFRSYQGVKQEDEYED